MCVCVCIVRIELSLFAYIGYVVVTDDSYVASFLLLKMFDIIGTGEKLWFPTHTHTHTHKQTTTILALYST